MPQPPHPAQAVWPNSTGQTPLAVRSPVALLVTETRNRGQVGEAPRWVHLYRNGTWSLQPGRGQGRGNIRGMPQGGPAQPQELPLNKTFHRVPLKSRS